MQRRNEWSERIAYELRQSSYEEVRGRDDELLFFLFFLLYSSSLSSSLSFLQHLSLEYSSRSSSCRLGVKIKKEKRHDNWLSNLQRDLFLAVGVGNNSHNNHHNHNYTGSFLTDFTFYTIHFWRKEHYFFLCCSIITFPASCSSWFLVHVLRMLNVNVFNISILYVMNILFCLMSGFKKNNM